VTLAVTLFSSVFLHHVLLLGQWNIFAPRINEKFVLGILFAHFCTAALFCAVQAVALQLFLSQYFMVRI